MFRFLFCIVLLGVAACQHTSPPGPDITTLTGAVCETAGIDSQYASLSGKTNDWRSAIGTGASLESGDAVDVISLVRKMDAYDAQVDALYRNVTNSCKLLTVCLAAREFQQNDCSSLYDGWRSAESAFTGLFVELAEIEADVAKVRARAKKGGGKKKAEVNRCDVGGRNCSAGAYDY